MVDSAETTDLVKTKLSKGSNSKTAPEEVLHTQAQSPQLKLKKRIIFNGKAIIFLFKSPVL